MKLDTNGEYLKITMTGENNKSQFPSEGVVLSRDQGNNSSQGTGVLMPLEEIKCTKSVDLYGEILREVSAFLSKKDLKLTARDIRQGPKGEALRKHLSKNVKGHCTTSAIGEALDWSRDEGHLKEEPVTGSKRMIVRIVNDQLTTIRRFDNDDKSTRDE